MFDTATNAQVVINELQYDDTGLADDREFIELFNAGSASIDISGWRLGGSDSVTGPNPDIIIPSGSTIAPGGYFVIGQSGVPNVNYVIPSTLKDDTETVELYNSSNSLVDAVLYEANRGISFISSIPGVAAEVGTGYWGNQQGIEPSGTPAGLTSITLARYFDGRDTNVNGSDFGTRPSTPGTSNQAFGQMSSYSAPNVDALANGAAVGGLTGSFKNARVITPGVVTSINKNPIPEPLGHTKAIVAWDETGGGNGVVSNSVFGNGGKFALQVYLDTNDLPVSSNSGGTQFTGSEETFYGIGGGDPFTNLADISDAVTISGTSANGATGVAWYYEKTSAPPAGGSVSEKLYLIDARYGGNSNADSPGGLDWLVLATIDLSTILSGWYDLSLSINPDGSGLAGFDGQTFTFTTTPGLVGDFYVGYRENTQQGTTTVPSYLRPPTFAEIVEVPEAGSGALFCLAGAFLVTRRRSRSASFDDLSRFV